MVTVSARRASAGMLPASRLGRNSILSQWTKPQQWRRSRRRGLIRRIEEEHLTDEHSDSAPFKGHLATLTKQARSRHAPEHGAIDQRFPIESIRSVQHYLERLGLPA